MDPYKETFATWDKIAALYKEKFMDLDLYNDTYDHFCAQLPMQHPVILELGCGPGNITRYLLAARPDFRIVATDISQNMITLAREAVPNANFRVLDSRDIHLLPAGFHGIIAGFCLPYLSAADCKKLVQDSYRLLYGEGIFYGSFVEGSPERSGFISGSSGDRTYFYYHTIGMMLETLTANHFTILEVIRKPYRRGEEEEVHTVVIAKKSE